MSTPFETQPWPVELRYKSAEKALEIDFDDDLRCSLPAELLRVESPSAEVMGHGEGKTIVPGRRHVGITLIEPVGNYAVRLHFDDLHTTGIYTWTYLRHLAEPRRGRAPTLWPRRDLEEARAGRASTAIQPM